MIYLVTNQKWLFECHVFEIINVEQSLSILNSWEAVQFDSETLGTDPHLGSLLCVQFGNPDKSIQIVVDTTSVDITLFKDILENHLIIGHNLDFDLKWLYNHDIKPMRIYDTMIVEQLRYLSYPQFVTGIDDNRMFRYKNLIAEYEEWESYHPDVRKKILYSRDSELADFLYNHTGFSLKSVAWRYLNVDIDKSVRGQIQYKGLTAEVIRYAATDVMYLYDIMKKQTSFLRSRNMLEAAKIECNFVMCNAYYEWCGVKIDELKWKKKMKDDSDRMNSALSKLNQFVIDFNDTRFFEVDNNLFTGLTKICTINWQSTKQVIPFLTALGFNCKGIDKKTKEEKESIESKVLKSQKGINDEFLKIYFDYTESYKVCSTYGQAYLNAVNPNTHRIHTVFRQLGTDTGRLACGSQQINVDLAKARQLPLSKTKDTSRICAYPQLQNLPNDALTRSCFIAEKGNDFISIDYNSEEARLLASLANDKAMLEVFNKGYDMHSMVAYMIYPDKIPRDTDISRIKSEFHDLRQSAKGPEFCFAFLGNASTLVANYGMSVEEAQSIEDNYKKGFYGATEYQETCKRFIEKNGYIPICKETGHKAYWWDWKWWKRQGELHTPEFWQEYSVHKEAKDRIWQQTKEYFKARSKWHKNSVNSTTQGLGSVIFKLFNYRFFKWIVENNLFGKVKFCIPAHDEICIECPKEYTEIVVPRLKQFMSETGELFCHRLPMPAEEEIDTCWRH